MPELPLVPVPLATISSRRWTPNPTALKSAKTTAAGCAARSTRGKSVRLAGDDPAITSCAIQRTLCTEFIRNKTWVFWYPIGERFDDEGESGATLERPGLAKLLQRIEWETSTASSSTASSPFGARSGGFRVLHPCAAVRRALRFSPKKTGSQARALGSRMETRGFV
jgi:hypothetical protein